MLPVIDHISGLSIQERAGAPSQMFSTLEQDNVSPEVAEFHGGGEAGKPTADNYDSCPQ